MKKIAIITTTRAEYGLLSPILRELRGYENDELKVDLIVAGTHLSEEYGMTIKDIQERIDYKVHIPVCSESELDISTNQSKALVEFTKLFITEGYDAIILLGDRYETLAIAIAAGNTRTPIFHLCGGDTTEGAIDEWIRHSITKISYLHFVTNEESRRRVIQLGENPGRVFNYGSTSIDNIYSEANLSKKDALNSIGLEDCHFALCTYHPVTMENRLVDGTIESILEVINHYPSIQFIFTKSNADKGGKRINELLDAAVKRKTNMHVYTSLGTRRYLSLMKYAEFVLGNSSSGIIEAPAFRVPTVNIGNRQKGRLRSKSVINCGDDVCSIITAIDKALDDKHREICKDVVSPYGDGHAAVKIARKVIEIVSSTNINLEKEFYDVKSDM